VATAVAATCAIAVSGCGDQNETAAATPPQSTPASTVSAPVTKPDASSPSTGATAPDGTATGDAKFKIGQAAVVPWVDASTPKLKGNVAVTPRSIKVGKKSDLKGMKLDADDKDSTPYYVKVHVKNVGHSNLTGSNPINGISGVDDRGQRQNAVIILGTYAPCPSASAPKHLKPGQAYDGCQVYLIPGGGSLEGMTWVRFDPDHPELKNIDWVK
jgi:hypothetical protein